MILLNENKLKEIFKKSVIELNPERRYLLLLSGDKLSDEEVRTINNIINELTKDSGIKLAVLISENPINILEL